MSFITPRDNAGQTVPALLYDDVNSVRAALGPVANLLTLPPACTLVTLTASGNCWYRVGTAANPPLAVAGTAGCDYLGAGSKWTRMVPANCLISVIQDGASTGALIAEPAFDTDAIAPAVSAVTGATFLTSSQSSFSSLDTGRVSYLTAWGGSEFGYAYTYKISGAPAGVTIDGDMGILSFGLPVAPGTYTFNVTATNRENPTVSSTLPFTMTVLQGVTAARTGTQILHKTYDPHSGTWGTPTGNDWTTVFLAMQTAIIADQVAAGDEKLRATWLARRGVTYQYTNNTFFSGIQYLRVVNDPAFVGALPIYQNMAVDPGQAAPYSDGPLNFGSTGAMAHQGSIKSFCTKLATVAAGASSATLLTPTQASRIVPGRWHVVMGSTTQLGGYPPNSMYLEYVKVTGVSASTGQVNFDRPLRYAYKSDWYEVVGDDGSFGVAWLVPFDMGGVGGASPSDPRVMMRTLLQNINFLANTNANNAGIILIGGNIDLQIEGCTMGAGISTQLTQNKHAALIGTALSADSEPDKQCETLFFDNCSHSLASSIIGGATGFSYWLSRKCSFQSLQISPRQFRDLGSTFDGLTSPNPVFSIAYPGPDWYYDFEATTFKATGGGATNWTYFANPNSTASINLGVDSPTWVGNQLRIPNTFGGFQDWLIYSYPGAIINTTGLSPATANWGYISNVTSDGAGGALWLDIVWFNGIRPTSGRIYITVGRQRRLKMTNVTFVAPNAWAEGGWCSTQAPPNANYGFPIGLPAVYSR